MGDATTSLQQFLGTNSTEYGSNFRFVLDTCSRLQHLTGATCAGAEAEDAAIPLLAVSVKVSSEFFDPDSYVENGY